MRRKTGRWGEGRKPRSWNIFQWWRKKKEDIQCMGFTLVFVCIFYSCSTLLQALCSVHLDALMSHNDSPQLLRQAVTDAQNCKTLYPESENKGLLGSAKNLLFIKNHFHFFLDQKLSWCHFKEPRNQIWSEDPLKYKNIVFFSLVLLFFYTALFRSEFILF